ncbi:MAG: DUF2225 domain-containing protein [Lachnospiraceae bacterium]|nr:DUF2225 domain-containing protein [Lachnospiraceae bacterium]
MGIFSGLEALGLDKIVGDDLFETEAREAEEKKKADERAARNELKVHTPKILTEGDYIFLKTYKCPCCRTDFKNPTVKSNKARLIKQDTDLRPIYRDIDPLKYDVVMCPNCGYAALTSYFDKITMPQVKLVRAGISSHFTPREFETILDYSDTYLRYQLALGNAMVKRSRASEKAFICLKTAWILRGYRERLLSPDNTEGPVNEATITALEKDEAEFINKAYEGFVEARANETPPICGMDTVTMDYLVAALAYKTGNLDNAARLVSSILLKNTVGKHTKDSARELKDMIISDIKKQKGQES